MPATIAALLRRADLGLTLLAGEAASALTADIRWVTTSELLDPTPYLRGGELLLTTGMRLKSAKADVAQYVSRLATTGVLGIGIGIGSDLAFRRPPARLVAAAHEHGLPLLLVDEPTPFIAIGEAVAGLHLADETAALAQALRGQQAITRAAVTEGPAGVVRRLAALLGGWAVMADADGTVLHEAPPGAGQRGHAAGPEESGSSPAHRPTPDRATERAAQPDHGVMHPATASSATAGEAVASDPAQPTGDLSWQAELRRLRDGHGGAAALVTPGEHVSIQALGETRGFLVTGRASAPSTAHHSMTNVAAALLTVAGSDSARGSAVVAGEPRSDRGADHGQAEAILAALAGYSRRSPVRLAESLRVWLAHHGRIEPAAAELGIHRNTLRYRIMKAERLLGRDLDDPAARAALWAALTQHVI